MSLKVAGAEKLRKYSTVSVDGRQLQHPCGRTHQQDDRCFDTAEQQHDDVHEENFQGLNLDPFIFQNCIF